MILVIPKRKCSLQEIPYPTFGPSSRYLQPIPIPSEPRWTNIKLAQPVDRPLTNRCYAKLYAFCHQNNRSCTRCNKLFFTPTRLEQVFTTWIHLGGPTEGCHKYPNAPVPKRKRVDITLATEQITHNRVKIIQRWWAPGVHHTTTIPARYSCQGYYVSSR